MQIYISVISDPVAFPAANRKYNLPKGRPVAKIGKMGEEKNKTDNNILRARDIIPPFGDKKQKTVANNLPDTEQKPTPSDERLSPVETQEKAPIKIRSIPESGKISPISTESDIPQFNLAEQIFAEQRKVSSGRRQRSGSEPREREQEQIDESGSFESAKPRQSLPPAAIIPSPASPQQRIIAEIIARDIKEMIIRNSQLKP